MNEEIMQFQMYQNQLKQITEYTKEIEGHKQNILTAIETLKDIKNTKENTKILAPIANGVFIEASLLNNKEVITIIGANTTVKKNIDDTIEMLNNELFALERHEVEINSQKEEITRVLTHLQNSMIQKEKIKETKSKK